MEAYTLPTYAYLVVIAVVLANLGTAWILVLTMGENNGSIISGGPPLVAALSVLCLVLSQYNILLPLDVSFWGSAFLAALGLWGAWVDYAHISDRRKILEKARRERKSAQ
ncbi:MAG: hypothetical protein IPH30_13670 [Betaproteobacteria bacterium]|nr:hypothetical protein [Betaproteobacteria bacterium]